MGFVNGAAAVLQMGSLVAFAVALLVRAPRFNSAKFVFTETYNGSGFDSVSYVAAVGLITSLWGFAGYEASAHMAEETSGERPLREGERGGGEEALPRGEILR